MNVFNSLGSNYNKRFIWKSIITPGSRKSTKALISTLSKHYGGGVVLTYKGRHSLELALSATKLPKDSVIGINGFTCYALYQAVERAGFQPLPIDVGTGELNFDVAELKAAHSKEKKLKVIIVQNTLGLVADMPGLEAYCTKHGIIIIEDLAHSLGARYSDDREAGTVGQYTMLSFSQDKPLDVVAGGALVDRGSSKNPKPIDKRVSLWQREINALYPMWASLIRATYPIGIGRYLHFGLKKLHLLATPMSDNIDDLFTMEPSAARLLLKRWNDREEEFSHRLAIAKVYKSTMPNSIQIKTLARSHPLYLRFPIKVNDRPSLIVHLKSKGIYVGDTWYDAPIAPKRYLKLTNYKAGDCPKSEKLAEHIVNLPTHINISERQAESIAIEVNTWLKSQ